VVGSKFHNGKEFLKWLNKCELFKEYEFQQLLRQPFVTDGKPLAST